MASIRLEVEIDGLENSDLSKMEDKFYEFLSLENCKMPSPFPGTVTNVTELDRDEDLPEESEE